MADVPLGSVQPLAAGAGLRVHVLPPLRLRLRHNACASTRPVVELLLAPAIATTADFVHRTPLVVFLARTSLPCCAPQAPWLNDVGGIQCSMHVCVEHCPPSTVPLARASCASFTTQWHAILSLVSVNAHASLVSVNAQSVGSTSATSAAHAGKIAHLWWAKNSSGSRLCCSVRLGYSLAPLLLLLLLLRGVPGGRGGKGCHMLLSGHYIAQVSVLQAGRWVDGDVDEVDDCGPIISADSSSSECSVGCASRECSRTQPQASSRHYNALEAARAPGIPLPELGRSPAGAACGT
jgi:hypothetical protein